MAYPFNSTTSIPFPTVPVVLRSVEGRAITSTIQAYVDTGADVTLVPAALLQSYEGEAIYVAQLRSHWGEPRRVGIYLVDVAIGDHLIPTVDVVADDRGDDVLLGRNVLNSLILLLDGPNSQTDLLTRRPIRL